MAVHTQQRTAAYFLFLGLSLDVAQPSAAFLNAALCSMLGFAFLTLAISDFMKMLYADGARGAFSSFAFFAMSVVWVLRGAREGTNGSGRGAERTAGSRGAGVRRTSMGRGKKGVRHHAGPTFGALFWIKK